MARFDEVNPPISEMPQRALTNPVHGGKVTCELCGGFIDTRFRYKRIGTLRYQHMEEHCPTSIL
jgi:hypothetical protein